MASQAPAQVLSNREVTALAGIFYSELTKQMADEPGNETAWQH